MCLDQEALVGLGLLGPDNAFACHVLIVMLSMPETSRKLTGDGSNQPPRLLVLKKKKTNASIPHTSLTDAIEGRA